MTVTRRHFLMRAVVVALAAGGAGGEAAAQPDEDRVEYFQAVIGDQVFFAGGRLDLDRAAKAILDRQIGWLKRHDAFRITLEGHTDERGTGEYCLSVSERRAVVVKTYMVAHGITPGRILTVGYGKFRPLDEGHTEAAWARNRRVVTRVER